MENTAFYLKYRPSTFDELIGQEAVKKILLSSFQNRLSHAYLFVGPRGTGKTSTARILAKMVNCEKQSSSVPTNFIRAGSSTENTVGIISHQSSDKISLKTESKAIPTAEDFPCNKCSTCISITDGSNLDLIEIDAASNRGIEDIRALRDKIKLAPTSCRKKVYIIDEVHMLTTEAFNALLKTLEEPPKHALFILATTEVSKIPQTILSRVQRLDFKLASPQEISQSLKKIIKEEKIDIEEEAVEILIRKADGSFRDGVKLLDQVSSGAGKITAKSLEETLKSSQFEDLTLLIKSFSGHMVAEGLLIITKQMKNGIDARELMLSLMDILRHLMFIKNGLGETLVATQYTGEKYEELLKLSSDLESGNLVRMLNILQNYVEKLKFASIPSLPVELAVVEICGEQLLEPKIPDKVVDDRVKMVEEEDRVPKIEEEPSSSDSPDILKLKEKWTFVLETIRPFNFSLEALLRSINVRECTKETVIMEVPYSFHQRILEAPKNRDLLESILSDILGRPVRISVTLGIRPERKEDIANVELAADDEIIRAAAEIFNSDTVN